MNRFRYLLLLCMATVGLAQAADIALLYESEAAVTQGKPTYGNATSDGILVSAQFALAAGKNLLAGVQGQDLHRGILVRLDNDLDLAMIRLGEVVPSQDLQGAFKKKWMAVNVFIPPAVASATVDQPIPLPPLAAPNGSGWVLKINGIPVGKDTIDLKSALRKSKFNAEVVCLSTSPVWSFTFKLTSNPKVSFWKQGRQTDLNNVPTPTFIYGHQALMVPLKDGKSVVIPIEAHYIDIKQEYDWKIEITSKKDNLIQTVRVKFH